MNENNLSGDYSEGYSDCIDDVIKIINSSTWVKIEAAHLQHGDAWSKYVPMNLLLEEIKKLN